jgi:hypothetical protein
MEGESRQKGSALADDGWSVAAGCAPEGGE